MNSSSSSGVSRWTWEDRNDGRMVLRARTAFPGRPFVRIEQMEVRGETYWGLTCFPKGCRPVMETAADWKPLFRWASHELL